LNRRRVPLPELLSKGNQLPLPHGPKTAPAFDGQAGPPPGDPKQGWWLGRTWAWIAAGSTVLLAAGAVVADLSMYSKIDSSESFPCGQGNYCYNTSDASSINERMVAAEVLAGLAAAAAVTNRPALHFRGPTSERGAGSGRHDRRTGKGGVLITQTVAALKARFLAACRLAFARVDSSFKISLERCGQPPFILGTHVLFETPGHCVKDNGMGM